jgi:prepilin-type N-terminal cleavage/methylation domain-containing protein
MTLLQPRAKAGMRRGLTLIELLVVLMILIALAGLLAPMLPSMLTRAHTSTCATNMSQTGQAILQFQSLYSQYPNNWDALGDGSTGIITYFAGGSAMPAGTASGSTVPGVGGNGELNPITLTAAEASALTGVGITSVQAMVLAPPAAGTLLANGQPFDPTFNYYAAAVPTPVAIGAGSILAGMDPTASGAGSTTYARCVALNLPLTGRYACLGVGVRNSMVGKTIQTPPVHFGDQPVLNPEYGYQRMIAIFKVSDSAVPGIFTQAQLVGVAPLHDTGLGSIQDELQNWYQLTTNGS